MAHAHWVCGNCGQAIQSDKPAVWHHAGPVGAGFWEHDHKVTSKSRILCESEPCFYVLDHTGDGSMDFTYGKPLGCEPGCDTLWATAESRAAHMARTGCTPEA